MRAAARVGPRRLMLHLVIVAALSLLLLQSQPARATVLHAFDGGDGVALHDRHLADLVAMHALSAGADQDDSPLFALHHDAEHDDVIVHVGGHGRARSDGITITRAVRREEEAHADEDQAQTPIVFSPSYLNVEEVEACSPVRLIVLMENRAARHVRINDVRVESEAFVLESDPRGVELKPGESVQLTFLLVVGEPKPFHSFVFVVTSVGEFALPVRGHTQPSMYGLLGLKVSVPVGAHVEHTIHLHNPSDKVLRVSEVFSLDGVGSVLLSRGRSHSATRIPTVLDAVPHPQPPVPMIWEIPPLETKPIARFMFNADKPTGRYRSTVRIATSATQFLIPFDINIRKDQFIIEPSDVDVGVFTNDHEQRHVLLTFHNTGSVPISIRQIRAINVDGLDVAADLHEKLPVLPPLSKAQHSIRLTVQDNRNRVHSGRSSFQLEIKTNASDTQYYVDVQGFTMRGHLAYSLAHTVTRLVAPNAKPPTMDNERLVQIGASASNSIILVNEFDVPLELESATLPESCADFKVQNVSAGVAYPSTAFSPIQLLVRPNSEWPTASHTCFLEVETNASVHHIPIVLFSGLLRISSTRNMSEQAFGDFCVNKTPMGENNTITTAHLTQHDLDIFDMKTCRQITLNMGRVAQEATVDHTINFTNVNPTSLWLRFDRIDSDNRKGPLIVETTTSILTDPSVPTELAILGTAWERRAEANRPSNTSGTILLSPGRMMSIRFQVELKTTRSREHFEPVATIETEFETIRLFVRLETVPGTIQSEIKSLDLPNIHPGHLGFVNVPFSSSMEHDVPIIGLELSSVDANELPNPFAVWDIPSAVPANSTIYAKLVYFSSQFYARCQRGRFYAECFVRDADLRPTSAVNFSDFGNFVTTHDIARLRAREQVWQRLHNIDRNTLGDRIDVYARLNTHAMLTPPVRITAYVPRPQFFLPATGSDPIVSFPLTELLHQFVAYITVVNPSDYAMDMELTITESDRDLFYACDDDLDEAECVREWQDIARECVNLDKNTSSSPVAPLFFKSRVVRVAGHDEAQVGPVYFFPSRVSTWQTQVFLRNELTHIEPLTITASSGLGRLSVSIPSPEVTEQGENVVSAKAFANGEIHFIVDVANSGTKWTGDRWTRGLQLTNIGSFDFVVSVHLTGVELSSFQIVADRGLIANGANGEQFLDGVVLKPKETLSLAVRFTPNCFHARLSSDLTIITRDGVTNYRLVGTMTPSSAFQCRRHLVSARSLEVVNQLWLLVTCFAGLAVVLAILQVIRIMNRIPLGTDHLKSKRTTREFQTSGKPSQGANDTEDTADVDGLMRSLRALENAPVPVDSEGVVSTPRVSLLLASRVRLDQARQSDSESGHRHSQVSRRKIKKLSIPDGDVNYTNQIAGDELSCSVIKESIVLSTGSRQEAAEGPVDDGEIVMVEASKEPQVQVSSLKSTTDEPREIVQQDDTASENDEDIRSADELVNNQTDAETGRSSLATADEDSGCADDLLAVSLADPFVSLSSFAFENPTPHDDDDDWNALAFDSLQSEIGRLVADESTSLEPKSSLLAFDSFQPSLHATPNETHTDHGPLTALSMAPPSLPMSSLFASAVGGPQHSHLKKVTKSAPPGFTTADANPEASRIVFGQLSRTTDPQQSAPGLVPNSSHRGFHVPGQVTATVDSQAPFPPLRYSLFGPVLGGSPLRDVSTRRGESSSGRIGSRQDGTTTSTGVSTSLRPPVADGPRRLASLGGTEL